MRDENDDEDLISDEMDIVGDDDEEPVPKNVDENQKKLEARRKLERMRELKQLQQQLGDDWYDGLIDEL